MTTVASAEHEMEARRGRPAPRAHLTEPVRATFGLRDAIIMSGMLMVAAAASVAAGAQFDLPEPIAAALGLALASLLLTFHLFAMRRPQPTRPAVAKAAAPVPAPAPAPTMPFQRLDATTAYTDSDVAAALPPRRTSPLTEPPSARPRGADSDAIASAVRALAGERPPGVPAEPLSPELPPTQSDPTPVYQPQSELAPRAAPTFVTPPVVVEQRESAITRSVEALREAAHSLSETPAVAHAPSTPPLPERIEEHAPVVAAVAPEATLLAEIAEAIENQRLETDIAIIPSLADDRFQHYEIIVRLRTRSGELIVPEDIQSAARASNVLPLLETLKIGRAVRLAQSIAADGHDGALISTHTADILLDDRAMQTLLKPLADARNAPELAAAARQVVLTFAEDEVRRFTNLHWTRLADLSGVGFRFAVDRVSDVTLDLELMRNVGFVLVRIDGAVLRYGVRGPSGALSGQSVQGLLGHCGMTLVVTGIDSQADLTHLAGLTPPFAQGALFRSSARQAHAEAPETARSETRAA